MGKTPDIASRIHICSRRAGGTPPDSRWPTVYVGRGSILGNIFPMHRESDRIAVILKYNDWLKEHTFFGDDMEVLYELKSILDTVRKGGINLQCWCAPKRCHAEIIKAALMCLDKRV